MAIGKLPEQTVKRLGSSVVIHSPVSIVKELIENSLDAGATSIQIEIDATTLERLQVRDNGAGIPSDDRSLMAMPYSTSKISSYSDLENVKSLGFRGEALASIAEICGSTTITSRTSQEQIAQTWIVNSNGKRENSSVKNVAGQVGTAIVLGNVFSKYPVRKKVMIKDAKKNIDHIRTLVLSFSILYSCTRFSLKVTKSSVKDLILTAGTSIIDQIALFYGIEYATNLIEGEFEDNEWKLHYAFSSQECDKDTDSKELLRTKFHLLGVDGRVMKTSLPEAKKIASHINSLVSDKQIWVLNIICPSHSYDVNIEPGKDDLQFNDLNEVLQGIDKLFKAVYKTKNAFEVLMTRPSPTESYINSNDTSNPTHASSTADINDVSWSLTMDDTFYSGLDNEEEEVLETEKQEAADSSWTSDVNLSNPFIIAKLNSRVRVRDGEQPLEQIWTGPSPESTGNRTVSEPKVILESRKGSNPPKQVQNNTRLSYLSEEQPTTKKPRTSGDPTDLCEMTPLYYSSSEEENIEPSPPFTSSKKERQATLPFFLKPNQYTSKLLNINVHTRLQKPETLIHRSASINYVHGGVIPIFDDIDCHEPLGIYCSKLIQSFMPGADCSIVESPHGWSVLDYE